eukprot:Skav230998  [mRNA]  locus=scaffold1822:178409:179728:- [translate_table: standard]
MQVLQVTFAAWNRKAQLACQQQFRVNAKQELVPAFLLAVILVAWRQLTLCSGAINGSLKAAVSSHARMDEAQLLRVCFNGWNRKAQLACQQQFRVNAKQELVPAFLLAVILVAWRQLTLCSGAINDSLKAAASSHARMDEAQLLRVCFNGWNRKAQLACQRQFRVNAKQELVPAFLLAVILVAWRQLTLCSGAINGSLKAAASSHARMDEAQLLRVCFNGWNRKAQLARQQQFQVNAKQELVPAFLLAVILVAWRQLTLCSGTINGSLKAAASSHARMDEAQLLRVCFNGWNRKAQLARQQQFQVNAKQELVPAFLLAVILVAWRQLTLCSGTINGSLKAAASSHARMDEAQLLRVCFNGWNRKAQLACQQQFRVNAKQELVPAFLLAVILVAWRQLTLCSGAINGSLKAAASKHARVDEAWECFVSPAVQACLLIFFC